MGRVRATPGTRLVVLAALQPLRGACGTDSRGPEATRAAPARGAGLAEGRGGRSVRVRVQAWRPEWGGGSREDERERREEGAERRKKGGGCREEGAEGTRARGGGRPGPVAAPSPATPPLAGPRRAASPHSARLPAARSPPAPCSSGSSAPGLRDPLRAGRDECGHGARTRLEERESGRGAGPGAELRRPQTRLPAVRRAVHLCHAQPRQVLQAALVLSPGMVSL